MEAHGAKRGQPGYIHHGWQQALRVAAANYRNSFGLDPKPKKLIPENVRPIYRDYIHQLRDLKRYWASQGLIGLINAPKTGLRVRRRGGKFVGLYPQPNNFSIPPSFDTRVALDEEGRYVPLAENPLAVGYQPLPEPSRRFGSGAATRIQRAFRDYRARRPPPQEPLIDLNE